MEAVSGIRCHTLRIWEQRYGVLKPKRSDTNIRFYDDEDLKHVLNISLLNKNGRKISEIAKMSKEEITCAIRGLSGGDCAYECQIKALIGAMMAFDEFTFQQLLTTNIVQYGLEETMIGIVFPFMSEVGILWQIGSLQPVHEHFASHLIKQKLCVAIDGNMGRYVPNRKKFLLFLPEGEQHSLGLLFANYLLRSRGHEVLYLGQEVPFSDLELAALRYQPDFVFTILTAAFAGTCKDKLADKISELWPDAQLLLTGIQCLCDDNMFSGKVKRVQCMRDFIRFAENINGAEVASNSHSAA
jgi:methanogenic corrinoid protein MtbC1